MENMHQHVPAMRAVYWYMRKLERINMVKALVESGLSVALIGGDSWKDVLPSSPKLTLLPACAHQAAVQWYREARSVVCTNGYNGASERVFDGMSAGALVVSEDAPHLAGTFAHGVEAFMYRPNQIQDRMGELTEVLRSGASQKWADCGQEAFLRGHTWLHRVQALNSVLEQVVDTESIPVAA